MRKADTYEDGFTPRRRRGRPRAKRREGAKILVKKLAWLDGWPVFKGEGAVWEQEQTPWKPLPASDMESIGTLEQGLANRTFEAIPVEQVSLHPSRLSAAERHLKELDRFPLALGYVVDRPDDWKRVKQWQLAWAKSLQHIRVQDYATHCRRVYAGDRKALESVVSSLAAEAGCVEGLAPRPSTVLLKVGVPAVEPLKRFITDIHTLVAGRALAVCLLRLLDPPGFRGWLKHRGLDRDGLVRTLTECSLPTGRTDGLVLGVQVASLGADASTVGRLLRTLSRRPEIPDAHVAAGKHLFGTGDVHSALALVQALADVAHPLQRVVQSGVLDYADVDVLMAYLRSLHAIGGPEAVGWAAEFARSLCDDESVRRWIAASGRSWSTNRLEWWQKELIKAEMLRSYKDYRFGSPVAIWQRKLLFTGLGTGLTVLSGSPHLLEYFQRIAGDCLSLPITHGRKFQLAKAFKWISKRSDAMQGRYIGSAVVLKEATAELLDRAEAIDALRETARLCLERPDGARGFLAVLEALEQLAAQYPTRLNPEVRYSFKRALVPLLAEPLDPSDRADFVESITYLFGRYTECETHPNWYGVTEFLDDIFAMVVYERFPRAVARLIRLSASHDLFSSREPAPDEIFRSLERLVCELGSKSGPFLEVFLCEVEAQLPADVHPEDPTIAANLSGRDLEVFQHLIKQVLKQPRLDPYIMGRQDNPVDGSRKLLNHPEIRAFLSAFFPEQREEMLGILRRLGLAARFNNPRLDTHLSRFALPVSEVEVPEDLQALADLDTEFRTCVVEWVYYAALAGEVPSLSRKMQKLLSRPEEMHAELEHLRRQFKDNVSPRIVRRMANLERYLSNGEGIDPKSRRNLMETMGGKVSGLKYVALQTLMGDFYLEYLTRIAGERVEGVRMTDDLVNAVHLYYNIDENRRLLKSLLIHHLRGESKWVRELPENIDFLDRMRESGIDVHAWLQPCERTFTFPHGGRKQVRLYLETDPIRILQMGNYFDTCLSFDQMNAFSTVANAVDLNKHVVYAEDEKGRIVGRKLVALNEQFELVGFHTYTSLEDQKANAALTDCFNEFGRAFARRCRLQLGNEGEVSSLAAEDWYDDGTCEWEDSAYQSC